LGLVAGIAYSVRQIGQKRASQIKRFCIHGQTAVRVARPMLLRLITIQFNPVVVGIAKINRFANPVVRGPFELDALDELVRDGLLESDGADFYSLTPKGKSLIAAI
jgi:hypothetical protein